MKISTIIFLLWVLLISACKKREYPNDNFQVTDTGQQIYFEGNIDNQKLNIKAGSDDYYCYSSYDLSEDSTYVFKAALSKINCKNCANSLQVEVSDGVKSTAATSVQVDSAFKAGVRLISIGAGYQSQVQFIAVSNKKITAAKFSSSDGHVVSDSVCLLDFKLPGYQTVSLNVLSQNNCENTISNRVYVQTNGQVFACFVEAAPQTNKTCQFTSKVIGASSDCSYEWSFGDGSTSNSPNPNHTYAYSGSYPVQLKVCDGENHCVLANYLVVVGSDKSSCSLGLSIQTKAITKSVFSTVKMQWVDDLGRVFRSDSIQQPSSSSFEIIESKPFSANERGESGRLLTLKFNLMMSNGSQTILVQSNKSQLAVTYK